MHSYLLLGTKEAALIDTGSESTASKESPASRQICRSM
ncbi:hypothetical protein CHCC20335_2966 [Bacillus paralicheniformis]|nr:hypothetical protein CHCC20335_2966 [Bacillus paralicheniformis]